ncbi:ATP/GTP-binding protein [Catellatospora sp. TT07R-123]|nr:ATP/GTP-binding protein [Catellatospora sp. TT07R-123]
MVDMSPRRNNPKDRADRDLDEGMSRRGIEHVRDDPDGEWTVRHLSGDTSDKAYRCPGCDQEIPRGVAHVVAWPSDGWGDPGDRRHWHTTCWRGRHQRKPNIQRSRNAPRYG